MAPQNLGTTKYKEDKLASGQITPAPRAIGSNTTPPKPPKKLQTNGTPKPALNDATGDFTIVCGKGRSIKAHKSVLRENCSYFERMFNFAGKVRLGSWLVLYSKLTKL